MLARRPGGPWHFLGVCTILNICIFWTLISFLRPAGEADVKRRSAPLNGREMLRHGELRGAQRRLTLHGGDGTDA